MAGKSVEPRWLSAHLYYHGRLDLVLTKLVAPLTEELALAGLAGSFFFLRYWDGGPHLRLRLRAVAHPAVRARLAERYAEFTRAQPAPDRLSLAEYQRQAAQLARWEQLGTYAPRPSPNNSMAFHPYRPETDRYGHGDNLGVVEQHFCESSRIALRMICAGVGSAHRSTAAFSMILLAWLIAGRQLAEQQSFLWRPDLDPAAEEAYRRQSGRLHELARRLSAVARRAASGLDSDGSADRPADAFTSWAASLARLRVNLADAPAPGQIIDTCAHLVCNRLGVELAEEQRLRYLAARTASSFTKAGGFHHAVA